MKLLDGRIEIPSWAVRLFGVALAVAIYIGAYKALTPEDRKAVRRAVAAQAVDRIVPSVRGEQMRVTPASVVGGLSARGEQMRVGDSSTAGIDARGEQMRVSPAGISEGMTVRGEQMRVADEGVSECAADENCRVRENDTPVGEWGMKVPDIEKVAEREKAGL